MNWISTDKFLNAICKELHRQRFKNWISTDKFLNKNNVDCFSKVTIIEY